MVVFKRRVGWGVLGGVLLALILPTLVLLPFVAVGGAVFFIWKKIRPHLPSTPESIQNRRFPGSATNKQTAMDAEILEKNYDK
jgi:hypothetical protein